MKRLASIGIKNFKDGMFSSDATELVGKAILLENIVHDDKVGKAVKIKDYAKVLLSNWAYEYLDDSSLSFEFLDLIIYSPEENLEYLVVGYKKLTNIRIVFFEIESDGGLTYDPSFTQIFYETVDWFYFNAAGNVLRFTYKNTTSGEVISKWYGNIENKQMFLINGAPQYSFNGFYLDEAKPNYRGVYFGDYTIGDDYVEADSNGRTPTDGGDNPYDSTKALEYFKSYRMSIQVDDSQESEYLDLMVSTAKTAKAPIIPINIDSGFSNRLTKIHIWRKFSKDPITSTDGHELIKTLDLSSTIQSTTLETDVTPLIASKLAVDHYNIVGTNAIHAACKQRVLIPAPITDSYNFDLPKYILVSSVGIDYYWRINRFYQGYIEFEYDANLEINDYRTTPIRPDEYASDFSAGVDSFTGSGGTPAGGIAAIGGVDDWLRLTLSGGAISHYLQNATYPANVGEEVTLEFDYYIPSGQTIINMCVLNGNGTTKLINESLLATTDALTHASVTFTIDVAGLRFAAGDGTPISADTDVIYIKNVVLGVTPGILISVGTYQVYHLTGPATIEAVTNREIEVSDVSYANLFVADNVTIIPESYAGDTVVSVNNSDIRADSLVVSNTLEYIITDNVALCSFTSNPDETFNLVGTSETLAPFTINPVTGGFTYDFTDEKPFEFSSGQFYSEEHGIIRGDFPKYSQAVKYNNRLFVIVGSDIRWSEVFKYDMFKPESIYSGVSDFNKIVLFRDVLFAFSENDVVVLNYAGTEVNWRTSDTLGDKGTRFTDSITVTPVGIFFADDEGIYSLASSMQMGKQSYTEFQRIDEPIEDQFDFFSLASTDLVGTYDSTNQRYVLSNASTGVIYIFSIKTRGWFLKESIDYPSIVKSVGRYGFIKDSSDNIYATEFNESVINDDYATITTGWLYTGDPHVKTWFRELFILLKNGHSVRSDDTTYYAKVVLIHDNKAVADWELGDVSNGSVKDTYLGSDLQFYEDIMKINGKLKKFRLKIYSNYPIFEYDNLEITYTPTGTY